MRVCSCGNTSAWFAGVRSYSFCGRIIIMVRYNMYVQLLYLSLYVRRFVKDWSSVVYFGRRVIVMIIVQYVRLTVLFNFVYVGLSGFVWIQFIVRRI